MTRKIEHERIVRGMAQTELLDFYLENMGIALSRNYGHTLIFDIKPFSTYARNSTQVSIRRKQIVRVLIFFNPNK